MDITTLAGELKGIIGMGPAPQPQAEAMGGQSSAMAMALMMMGDQADDGDREIAANFKKLAQKYGEFITKATGKKGWNITVGDDLFSIENPKEKTVIDIYWEFDPGNHLADVTVEVTKGGKHKLHAYRRQTMQDIGNQHAPESYLNPLLAFLEHEMEKVAELAVSEDGYVDRPYGTPLMERLVLWSDEHPELVGSVEDPGTMGMEEATASGKTSYEVPSPGGSAPKTAPMAKAASAPAKRKSDVDKEISQTIFQQFGGGRAMQMIGGKAMMIPNGLAVKWPNKERTRGNYVEIILDLGSDTYDVEFFNAKGASKKSIKKLTGIYADDLRDIFEKQTGWFLSMGRMKEDAENWSLFDEVYDDIGCVSALAAMGFELEDAMEIMAEALQTKAERNAFYDKIKASVDAKKAADAKKKADTEAGAAKHYKGLKFKKAEIPSHKHKYGPGVAVAAVKKGWKMVFGKERKLKAGSKREGIDEANGYKVVQKPGEDYWYVKRGETVIGVISKHGDKYDADNDPSGQGEFKKGFSSTDEAAAWIAKIKAEAVAQRRTTAKDLATSMEELAKVEKKTGSLGWDQKAIDLVANIAWAIKKDDRAKGQKLLDLLVQSDAKVSQGLVNEVTQWLSSQIESVDLTERQKTDPAMAFPGEDEPTRQGAFKVSSKILRMMRKDYGYSPDEALFKRVREKLMEVPSEELPPLWGKADMVDAQDVIAGRPRHAFQLWLRNIHKLPKVHVYLQKTPENTPLVYYLFISRVSGQDMADIIFRKWFETDQYFKPASTATSDLVAKGAEEGIMSVADELKSIIEQGCQHRQRGKPEEPEAEEPEDEEDVEDEDEEEMGEGKCKGKKKPVSEATLNLGAANPNTKRYWELYIKASDAARFMINMNRPNDRKLLDSYLPPEEAKELVTLWKKVFERKPAEGGSAKEDLDEAAGPVYLSQGFLTIKTDAQLTRDDIDSLRDELVTMTRAPRGRPLGGRDSYHVTDVKGVGKGVMVSFESTMTPCDRVIDKIEDDLIGHGFGGLVYDFAKQSAAPDGFDKRAYGAYVDDEESMRPLDRIESNISQTIVAQSEWVMDEAMKSPEERGRRYGKALAQTAKRKGDLPAGALAKLGGERGGTSFQRGNKPKLKPGEKMVFGKVVKVEGETTFGDLIGEIRDVLDERKGSAYSRTGANKEADLWNWEKQHVQGGPAETKFKKKAANKAERQAAKSEIQARLKDEHLQMDVAIMLAEELSEAAALTLPGEANLQDTLAVMRDAAGGMVKGMTEFAKYLDDALKGKRLDISKLGTYGRQLSGSYRLFQDLFTDLTLAVREEIEGRHYSLDEDGTVFVETIGLDLAEAMAVGLSSYDVPSPLGTSETTKAAKETRRSTVARVGEFVDLQGIRGEGPVASGVKRRLEVVAREMARKLKNGGMFYISDPDRLLDKKEYMQIFQDAMEGYKVEFEPVKSPKTGKRGWRVTPARDASAGTEVAPGATFRLAEVAFQGLKLALKGKKLDTEAGEPREVNPDEFMLMQITKDGVAQFKHRGSRNYVFLKNQGKLDIPKTDKPFFRGTFDYVESMDEATAAGKTSYDVPEAPRVAPPRAPSGGMVAAPAWSEYRAQGSSKSAKATVIDSVSGETTDPDDGPAPDMTKVKKFAEKLQAAVEAYYRKEYPDTADRIHIPANMVSVKPRKKMIAIDVGSSGKYLVGPNDFVWGIKGYGVRHPGYFYGKIDELLKANFKYNYNIYV